MEKTNNLHKILKTWLMMTKREKEFWTQKGQSQGNRLPWAQGRWGQALI